MSSPARFTSALEVAQTIRNGASCAILVEGEEEASDARMLQNILKSRVSQAITFHGRDGRWNLLAELPSFVELLPAGKVVAIVDRDFMDETVVEQTYIPDYQGHLFYWRRYCIENYLLEPAWIADLAAMALLHKPEDIPKDLASAESVEKFLLDWSRRLIAQVAGNWVIADLTHESYSRKLSVEAPKYFDDLAERDSNWVVAELRRKYGGVSGSYSELFSADALQARFTGRLEQATLKIQTLSGALQVVDGKRFFKKALLNALPSSLRPYFFNLLADKASKEPPEDIRCLVEERILPRWRAARQVES